MQRLRVLDGVSIAKELTNAVKRESVLLRRRPGLAALLVGDRPDSRKYVSLKQDAASRLGFHSEVHTLPADASLEEVTDIVNTLNEKHNIDGILVQLPLPKHINTRKVLQLISPEKDVDGFHPLNVGRLSKVGEEVRQRGGSHIFEVDRIQNAPCTPLGCIELLDRAGISMKGKRAVVIGRSNLVGLPLATMLLHRDATVTICHSKTPNLKEVCKEADVLIAACGSPEMVRGDWVKEGAVVIDVGINYISKSSDSTHDSDLKQMKPVGDVKFDEVSKIASVISPVPGGVGPMTVAMLMRNTLENAKRRQNEEDFSDREI